MAIPYNIYDTGTLLGVMEQLEAPSNYWLDLCFQNQMTFTDQYIDFEKITNYRKLAPFVAPTAKGEPIYNRGSTVTRLKPAYMKPKDAVEPSAQMGRKAGNLLGAPLSPAENYQANVAGILRQHREAIERRWEWLAAQAIINGRVTISGENYPEQVIDFKRASGHTITLGSGSRWNDSGVSILENIEDWRTLVRRANFGGPTNRITVGTDVWDVMRKDTTLLKQLDTQMRGTDANFRTGVREGTSVEFVGRLSGTLDIYVYSDYYQDASGTSVDFMSSKDIVLTGPNVMGYRCFGAILDVGAAMQPLPIFPKQWNEEDPSGTFIMSQSAPLMVPVNPNNTLKATVLA